MRSITSTRIFKLFPDAAERERVLGVLDRVAKVGGHVYIVGGAVRDLCIDRPIKDVDIEVHGIALEQLEALLKSFGVVNTIGKFFGVLRWEHSLIDWAIPRKDYAGRKPQVTIDPAMGIVQALRRRDLTINAMALDLATGHLEDPFGGYKDLMHKIARSPDPRFFTEDPLRFYRVMQFIARFELEPDDQLNQVCSTMSISDISSERIEAEFDKLFLLSTCPSRGIRWIESLGRLSEVLPELAATVGILQEQSWHPEGDVFEHTMQAIDAAAECSLPDAADKLTLVSAVLCHDLGKAVCTYIAEGRIRSKGHAEAGVPLARCLMNRITSNKKRIATVCTLVKFHMDPSSFIKNNASLAAYRRLAVKLAPYTTCAFLALVVEADRRGRNPLRTVPLSGPIEMVEEFKKKAAEAGVLCAPLPPLLSGLDLLDTIEAGPELGEALKKAYDMQIKHDIRDKDELKKRLLKILAKGLK